MTQPPECPRCGSKILYQLIRHGNKQWKWRCGTWMNGAGDIPTLRCKLRTLLPWRKGKPIIYENTEG